MKRTLIIFFLMAYVVSAQSDDKTIIVQLNQQVVTLYNSGKVDEALKIAQKSLELTLKTYSPEGQEAFLAYTNLGTLQREKGKYGDAVKNLQTALEIYRKLLNFSNTKLIEMYQMLGFSQFLAGKKTEAESNYLVSISLSETIFGAETKATFTPTLNTANLYARIGNFNKADEFYLKSYRTALKNFGAKSKEVEQVADARVCLADNSDKKREELFDNEFDKIFGLIRLDKSDKLINGKALSLIKPPYPQAAKEKRLTGTVKIRVRIDEKGNVVAAKSACGDGILEKAAEETAWLCKFSPTLVNGKAVKVTGVVVYRFSAQ